jgi:hypothetical protein
MPCPVESSFKLSNPPEKNGKSPSIFPDSGWTGDNAITISPFIYTGNAAKV